MAESGDDLLRAPLLLQQRPSGGEEVILDIGSGGDGAVRHFSSEKSDGSELVGEDRRVGGEPDNPFEFLGAEPLSLPPPSPLDPFRNHTHSVEGIYEWSKIVLLIPVALVRLVLFGLALLVGFLATKMALYGWKDRQNPMPKWRCRIMWITRICSRFILFSFGYHWIKRIGRPVSREIAPIVVSNHVSYIEPIFFFYELFPTMVASESHDSIPFVGTIIRAMQVIYVDRFSAPSRKHAVNEIKRKASCDGFPRVLLFPEGTTTNGRVLISFQLGAFIPGFPIQPVVVRYPYLHFDQSWGHISLAMLMFRMFTQIHNFMEVEYLPIIFPPEKKRENAYLFAAQTGYAMASALNVVQTSHSYGDLMLLTKASQICKDNLSMYIVEMAWVDSSFNVSTSEAMGFLDKFLAMKRDCRGRVKIHDFLAAMKLGLNPLSEKIFRFIDMEERGSITFREFLLGSAHILRQPTFHQACEMTYDVCNDEGEDSLSIQKLEDIVRSALPGACERTVHELLYSFDVDKDGTVSRDDFMTWMRRNPLLIALFDTPVVGNNILYAA